jgi:hypothetical protein
VKLRCLACETLNEPGAPECVRAECGADLRYADKVHAPDDDLSGPAAGGVGAALDAELHHGQEPAYCDCDPAKRSASTATTCFICDRLYRPQPPESAAPQPPVERQEGRPETAVIVLSGGIAVAIRQGLLLGREVHGLDSHAAAALRSHAGISRVHAWIARERDSITVLDLGSRNGTWVAGRRLGPGDPWRCTLASLPVLVHLGGTASMVIQLEQTR